jgi:hypothetical protein
MEKRGKNVICGANPEALAALRAFLVNLGCCGPNETC